MRCYNNKSKMNRKDKEWIEYVDVLNYLNI
jgi:hypothetical protein